MLDKIHPRGYWLMPDRKYRFDKRLAQSIAFLAFNCDVATVVDVGCGGGQYVDYFRSRGYKADGFDGNPHTEEITNGVCQVLDFSKQCDIGSYDLVISLEVAEHIPEEYEEVFIQNLLNATKDILILSWAVEGQGGEGHINCRNNDYVIEKMSTLGMTYLKAESEFLRGMSKLRWFKNTIMVFRI